MEEKRETKEREFGDENMYTVLFTAGTALLMVGLKRAVMMFFIEQWRFWVFLVLNLVLLAIFFTSMHNPDVQNQEQEGDGDNKRKIKKCGHGGEVNEENEEDKECGYFSCDEQVDEAESNGKNNKLRGGKWNENENEEEAEEEEEELEPPSPRLSKEELNERVEAFIATFRKHLVLDARKGRELHYNYSRYYY
ncbi:ABC transporter F family member 4 [Melia azedarach]|uniref:ABC transporter F family member 4 n=1 Tax=Melia azedarach TaxID=155640 RepID=A0ACC1X8T2_MELAZ|nr:ABC transporter F family member 4 [Melia azedarach]